MREICMVRPAVEIPKTSSMESRLGISRCTFNSFALSFKAFVDIEPPD
jgi:hypothetical protein